MKQLSLFPAEDRPMSFTQLATFLRCRLEYKLRFIDGEVAAAPFGTEVLWGRLLHKIAYDYLRLPIKHRSVYFLTSRIEKEVSARSISDEDYYLRMFADAMQHFHDTFAQTTVHSLEAPFSIPFHGFMLRGRVDCVVESQDTLILFEFKYRDFREFDYESDVDRYLQLAFYSLGLKGRGLSPEEGSYFFFDTGVADSIELSEAFMNRTEKRLVDVIDRIAKTDEFRPTANRLCRTCGYRKSCALYQGR